jgi:hypothetical protein
MCALDNEVTLLPPPGMACPDNTVLELKRTIYGLCQEPLVWYRQLLVFLKSIGFHISMADPCVFWRHTQPGREDTLLFAHVDDLVIVSRKPEVFCAEMEAESSIKYAGEAVFLLGMNIERSESSIRITQEQYIDCKLLEYGFQDATPAIYPLNPNAHLKAATQHKLEAMLKTGVNYRALVGLLNYLSVLMRPNILYAVSALLQYLDKPGIHHYHAAAQVFWYLKGTCNLGLTFFQNQEVPRIRSYVDADWGNCPNTRRSTLGFTVQAGNHLLAWKAAKQTSLALDGGGRI